MRTPASSLLALPPREGAGGRQRRLRRGHTVEPSGSPQGWPGSTLSWRRQLDPLQTTWVTRILLFPARHQLLSSSETPMTPRDDTPCLSTATECHHQLLQGKPIPCDHDKARTPRARRWTSATTRRLPAANAAIRHVGRCPPKPERSWRCTQGSIARTSSQRLPSLSRQRPLQAALVCRPVQTERAGSTIALPPPLQKGANE